MRGIGTIVNVATVLLGTVIGAVAGSRLPERFRATVLSGIGLMVLVIGVQQALKTDNVVFPLVALIIGAVAGELLRLQERLDAMPASTNGFIAASLVFCVGPLTILGSIQNGLTGDIQLLAVKSLLDGIAAVAFAAALGAGVYLSALTVLVIQGSIAFGAFLVGASLDPRLVAAASVVGGLLLVGVGLRLLEIRDVRVVNFLPGLLLAPVLIGLVQLLGVG